MTKRMREVVLFVFGLTSAIVSFAAGSEPPGYAIASAHPLATAAGIEILEAGGNAFDAAVAVSAALAVVEPYHSGLGGGGFWLLHEANKNKNTLIDGREVAPLAATETMFIDKKGKIKPDLSLTGGLAAAIPGEPAALVLMAKRFGRLSLSRTLAPAIRYAEEGFIVDTQLNYFLTMEDRLHQLQRYPSSAAIFLSKGDAYSVGARLIQTDLAHTLRALATQGHDGFYRGEIARRLVAAVHKAGGVWSMQDLETYHAKIRKPLEGHFHGIRIITAPLPSAGGVSLLTMLHILAPYPLETYSKAQQIHYIVEAMRLAFWQRANQLADPDFVNVPLQWLLSSKNAAALRHYIDKEKATPSDMLSTTHLNEKEGRHTTHFSIIDKEGNRVSATLSINFIFGSSLVADGTGVLLNDEMDDFTIKPEVKNVFGLVGGIKNNIAPGKRPLSSMTPTFLETPTRIAILGTPGGSRIPSMVLLATLGFSAGEGAISMVSTMRFHHQYLPDWLQFEPETFSSTLKKQLQTMGYHLKRLDQYYGDMQVITWDKEHGFLTAASDPRHIGLSVVRDNKQHGYGLTH